jgi:acetyltransferase-like isoleucine patch superfamily enzyme
MKTIVEKVIRLRNPTFKFDSALTNMALIQFIWIQSWNMLRALRVVFFLKSPKGAMFGTGVKFFNLSQIKWGRFLKLGDNVYISALGKTGVELGSHVGIGAYSRIVVSMTMDNLGEYIKIGNNVGIGEFAYLGGAGGLEIGDHCIIGQYLSCHPENHVHDRLEVPIRLQSVIRKGIKVGKNCWIGSKVTILDGVELGDGCIIAAGAVVNKSFPANSVIGGVPAKLIYARNEEHENNTNLSLLRKSI